MKVRAAESPTAHHVDDSHRTLEAFRRANVPTTRADSASARKGFIQVDQVRAAQYSVAVWVAVDRESSGSAANALAGEAE